MSGAGWILYIIFLVALMYFIAIRPQQKERKKMQALLASVAVGDSVLTSSGSVSYTHLKVSTLLSVP